jgi:hypothetical protein
VKTPGASERGGIGIVVTCIESPQMLRRCLSSIHLQTRAARKMALVLDERYREAPEFQAEAQRADWLVRFTKGSSLWAARTIGAEALLGAAPELRAIAFISENVRLEPDYIATCEFSFERQPEIGVMLSWMRCEAPAGRGRVHPAPVLLGELSGEQGLACFAVDAEAIAAAIRKGSAQYASAATSGEVPRLLKDGGWSAVTYPGVLATVVGQAGQHKSAAGKKRYSAMAMAQFNSSGLALGRLISAPFREKVRLVRLGIPQAGRVARWIVWQTRSLAGRTVARWVENAR